VNAGAAYRGDHGLMPGSEWIVVVVRAWVQGDDRLIRMTLSGTNGSSPVVTYEPTSAAAGRRLALWVDELAGPPGAAYDARGDGALMPEGRNDDADLPTVSEPHTTSRRHEES
jgi:hypothetical protein